MPLKWLTAAITMRAGDLWASTRSYTPSPLWLVCHEEDVRLVEGSSELEGTVEVCWNNEWGTVCSQGWDNNDARVVCRQLGFSVAGTYIYAVLSN